MGRFLGHHATALVLPRDACNIIFFGIRRLCSDVARGVEAPPRECAQTAERAQAAPIKVVCIQTRANAVKVGVVRRHETRFVLPSHVGSPSKGGGQHGAAKPEPSLVLEFLVLCAGRTARRWLQYGHRGSRLWHGCGGATSTRALSNKEQRKKAGTARSCLTRTIENPGARLFVAWCVIAEKRRGETRLYGGQELRV